MPQTFAELQSKSNSTSQVHKALAGVAFLAPASAAVVTSLTETDGSIKTLPAKYIPVGLVSKDGYEFSSDTDTETVEALGYVTPVREDVTSRTREVTFECFEVFRRPLLELAYGVDLSAVAPAANGEVSFSHPTTPVNRDYRLLIIAKDGAGDDELYRAKFFPRVVLSELDEEVWNAEDAMSFKVTLKAMTDATLGTAEVDMIGGPGVKKAELGFGAGS